MASRFEIPYLNILDILSRSVPKIGKILQKDALENKGDSTNSANMLKIFACGALLQDGVFTMKK